MFHLVGRGVCHSGGAVSRSVLVFSCCVGTLENGRPLPLVSSVSDTGCVSVTLCLVVFAVEFGVGVGWG